MRGRLRPDCAPSVPYCQDFEGSLFLDWTGFSFADAVEPARTTNWDLYNGSASGLSGGFLSFRITPVVEDFVQCATSPRLDATGIGDAATLTLRQAFYGNQTSPGGRDPAHPLLSR